jgi:nucleobase:cation symporter-1, NCS1 family
VATANGFLNFLGGYSIFQGPVVAIMIVDYFFIRRGNLTLEDLYTRSSWGRYYYFHGFNVRAFVSFVIGFLLPLPGFAASFGHDIGAAATRMYALGWVLSFLMGGLSYFLICLLFKVPGDDGRHPFESKVAESQDIINNGLLLEGQRIEKDSHLGRDSSVGDKEARAGDSVV